MLTSTRLFLAAAAFTLASGAHAASFGSFTDRTSFLNSALAAGLTATNEGLDVNPGDPFMIFDGFGASVTLDIVEGNYSTVFFSCGGCIHENDALDGLIQLASTGVIGSVVGIGFDVTARFESVANIELNSGAEDFSSIFSGPSFFGALSTDGGTISSIDLLGADAPSFPILSIDNIVVVTAPAIPLPPSLLLMGSVIALGGVLGRRSRAKSRPLRQVA